MFLLLSVVAALLAVATPLLAGEVVDAITSRAPIGVLAGLALLIGAIAVVEAGASSSSAGCPRDSAKA